MQQQMITNPQPQTYWIVFKKGVGWYCPFMKQNFGHCLILTQDGFNWYICDPTRRKLEFKILSYNPKYNLPNFLHKQEGHKLIKLTMLDTQHTYIPSITFFSCVTIVKYILNLKMVAFTPYQLYNKLRKLERNLFKQVTYGIKSISVLL